MIRKIEPAQEPVMQNAWDYGKEHGERLVDATATIREMQAGLDRKTAELQKAWDDLHRERAQVGRLHAENIAAQNRIEELSEELLRWEAQAHAQAGVDVALRERALEMAMVAQRDGLAQGLMDTAWLFLGFLAGTVPAAQPEVGGSQLAETAPPNVEITTHDDDEIVFYPEPDGSKSGE